MSRYTPHQVRYFAEQVLLKRPQSSVEALTSAMSGVKVDLNPHQVDAAMFALKSPLSNGALLADEVGLGKTIEAGLVLAQFWAERRRRILLIVPASLRTQWRAELSDKFYIESSILESTSYNKARKAGKLNPFEINNQVVICSFNFAASKEMELRNVPWDLVIIDEAHRLRNVYKPNNVIANKLRKALEGRKKLLLTATPLQNNLMELYGLVSIIDDQVFGGAKTFRDMYVAAGSEATSNALLKKRLQPVCKRTLRKQVTEYIRYTNRLPILQEYEPNKDEELLYNSISSYLQSEHLYALPKGQRTLITLVLRKLLASSSFAIAGTLASLISRLEAQLQGIEQELNMQDYDTFEELSDENEGSNGEDAIDLEANRDGINRELAQLQEYADIANRIQVNAKGDNLILALQKGFERISALGGARKAVIFTESRRTQEYLLNLLNNNGYEGQIVFLNGSNNDAISKHIYEAWKKRHQDDGQDSGSRQADIKAAMVEEFRDRASILIGTEAAAEGINLQFCSLVVNYDLPWNPQRIEQRIGRCHRYGQQNDVVVINFLNNKNAADRRVYELLSEKFNLFDGLFGSSDEVLGSIESGMDFEKRIADIYQQCKTTEEIQEKFDTLQAELSSQIQERMVSTRQTILENFDEEVASRLKGCQERTLLGLDQFSRWLYYFFLMQGAQRVEPLSQFRIRYHRNGKDIYYNLKWKDAEQQGDIFLRRDDPICQDWLAEAVKAEVPPTSLRFHYSQHDKKIGFFDTHPGLTGILSMDKVTNKSINTEEHLLFTVITQDGVHLDEGIINQMMELPATWVNLAPVVPPQLSTLRQSSYHARLAQIEEENKQFFLAEAEKLDAFAEDLKQGLQRDLQEL